ncbi:cell surface protein [Methanosarcina barkeri str. Wiesmoor]|uniref:Cell surface protein n=1 Tax=Methanosarcina barkeri str. Wiesmoor TaxID=1434109 RepID=A0A0E3QMA3_METBA|nr:cell surface protein [Methanosarcina barkeri str. Wiesmoor]
MDALNNCADGDTIFVMNGVYEIGANKNIHAPNVTFMGESRDGVIIKSNNQILSVGGNSGAAPNCVIENFTGMVLTQMSNGISISSNSPGCIVQNVEINVPINPIRIESSECIVRNCIFDGCYNTGCLIKGKNVTLKNNTISNTTSTYALYLYTDATAVIEDNIFKDNNCRTLYIRGENSAVANNTFLNNQGEIIRFYKSTATNNTITRNNIASNEVIINFKDAGNGNKIFLNNFVNNSGGMSGTLPSVTYWNSTEPIEYTYNGTTYTGYLGNFWGTAYDESDGDGNGIGDSSYTVPSSFGTDYSPLMSPKENYGTSETNGSSSAPSADFSATPTSGTAPLAVNFTDQSTGTPTSWKWDFGDGADSTEQNVSHTYTSDGTYTVNLKVSNSAGNDIEIKNNYITVNNESEWLEFQKDSSHTGYTFSSAPIKDPKVLWQNLTSSEQEPCGSGGINVPPVISGNTVFVTAGNASIWAFDKDTGAHIWSKELGGSLTQTATPALGDGKLFVPTLGGDLYALDPENGSELWNTHVTDSSFECPLTYSDHKLYIGDGLEGGNGTKYYYCYDDNGSFVWKHENTNTAGFIWSGSVVVGNYMVYPVFEGKLVCLDKDTGTFVDQVDFSNSSDVSFALTDPGMFRSSVTYANGALYTSSERGQETGYCFKVGFDPDTGQFLDSGWAASIGFSTSTPTVYDGRVYVGHGEHGETGSMFCLNDSDGSVIWKTPVSGGVKSSPVISIENNEPYIYFTEAISDGSIYCLNPDGTLAWHYNPPEDDAYTLQGAALSEDKVYYGTDSGYLYCIGQGEALSPTANFSSNKQTGSFPLTVSFKDRSFNANKFLWDFGDGNTSTEVNPVHTYSAAGTYTVTLTVQNEHGTDKKIADDYIYAVRTPVTWPVKSGESIQTAINAASSGDIIKVYPGEYHEVVTINKTLTLKGVRDPILNASGFTGTSGVTISADDVEFNGFKVTGTGEKCFGISVSANNSSIEDNIIDNCAEGVAFMGTGNILQGNTISNCWDSAAMLDNTGGNRLYQNTFINNSGKKTGGSNNHISGGSGSFFQSSEQVEYLWNGQKLTGYIGNYYDDYTGNDSNGDGIGDSAYAADKGTDQYPLVLPYSNYVEQENSSIPENSWFQFHGKIDHLGYSEKGPKTNRIAWVSKDVSDATLSSSPVVAKGKVFVISGGAGMEEETTGVVQLVALNESTGDTVWHTSIPKTVLGSWASPAYDNGRVFTATGHELGCYDAENGEKLWCFNDTVGAGAVNSGPAIADGMVIFSDWDGSHYYCLDEYTGDLLWSFVVEGDAQSVPAYADGKFYLTSWDSGASRQGHAYCVDAVTGKQIWHIDVEQNFCGSPAYKDGVLYLTTYNFYGAGDLFALKASDGSVIWQQVIPRTDSTPALAYGNVYISGGYVQGGTLCFNATTGDSVWSNPPYIGDWPWSVAVADGLAYVGGYAFDAFTGEIVWSTPSGGSTPALSDGMLFIIGDDKKVYAFKDSSVSPVANFIADVTVGEAPLAVQFTDTSSGSPASWAWDFENDGTVDSTEQNPSYTYNAAGNYTVNLTVINANGTDSEAKTDYITVSSTPVEPEPIAAFTADVTRGTVPLTVNFTDQSTGTPTSWLWDFGDGTNATEQNVSHTYISAGNYTVNLTVANADGNDSEVKTDYVVVSEPLPGAPVANFTANVTTGTAPLTVEFTDISTGSPTGWQWDFNDDGIIDSTEQNPVYTYSTVGNYTVNLTVVNADGNDSEVKTEYIVVSEPLPGAPVANFTATPTSGNAPLTVNFTDQSTGNISSYAWDFDNDGTVDSTEQNPIYTYSVAGTYTVNLTVSNEDGNDSEVKTEYIIVSELLPGAPVANFTVNKTSGKAPLDVQFTDASTGNISSYAWDFDNDGTIDSNEQSPLYTYASAGTYTVNLTVANANGNDSEVKTGYIKVSSQSSVKPVAEFSASPTSGKTPLKVKFTDTSTGSPTSWFWKFGDGSKSFHQNPVHKYSKAGTYTVNLTVKNAKGKNTVTKTEYIKVITKPVANFSANPTSGKTPLKVKFTDTSTGIPAKWRWDFGDGAKSFLQTPVHKYSKAGTYTVNLTVKNAKGKNTVTKTQYIKVITKPAANFTSSVTSGKTPLKVKFTDTSTGIPAKWRWDFGDGSDSFHQNPVHKYSKAGTYTVNLTVKNAKGKNTVTKTQYIKVITKPVANFTSSVTSGKTPLKVKFTDTSTGIPAKWRWDFGDGSKSFHQNPIHKYSKAGTYTVNLTVKNAKGKNTVTKTQYIKVI